NPGPASRYCILRALQCGHGWATVENGSQAGLRHPRPLGLQCGHGWATVENNSCWLRAGDRGRQLQCGHGWATVENAIRHGRKPASVKLQCGHGWATVENAASRAPAGNGAL